MAMHPGWHFVAWLGGDGDERSSKRHVRNLSVQDVLSVIQAVHLIARSLPLLRAVRLSLVHGARIIMGRTVDLTDRRKKNASPPRRPRFGGLKSDLSA